MGEWGFEPSIIGVPYLQVSTLQISMHVYTPLGSQSLFIAYTFQ